MIRLIRRDESTLNQILIALYAQCMAALDRQASHRSRCPSRQGIKGRVIDLDMSADHLMSLGAMRTSAIEPFVEQA